MWQSVWKPTVSLQRREASGNGRWTWPVRTALIVLSGIGGALGCHADRAGNSDGPAPSVAPSDPASSPSSSASSPASSSRSPSSTSSFASSPSHPSSPASSPPASPLSAATKSAPTPGLTRLPSPPQAGGKSSAESTGGAAVDGGGGSAEPVWFEEVGDAAGIRFTHVSGNSPQKPFPAANGSGLATFDFDRDGWHDLFFCTGTAFPLAEPSKRARCRLYRNAIVAGLPTTVAGSPTAITGSPSTAAGSPSTAWRFEDVTLAALADIEGFCAGVAAGDYDNDGFPDLYITRFGPNVLLRNQGDGTFQRVELEAAVADPRWAASAAFFDADEDGSLDLYVCNYAKWTWETNPYCGDRTRGIRMHCGPNSMAGERDAFYRSQGDGTFREQLDEAGMGGAAYRGQGVVAGDLDDDGHVDLYVGNDLHPNLVFMGDGRGRFRDATETSGAAYDANGAAQASMGVDMADITGDGLPELFTTNFQLEYNAFYENLGRGLFLDASARFGLVADSLVHVGWGTQFADFDLDGKLDLIVVNGHVDDNRHEIGENSPYTQPVLLYRFDGRRFVRVANRVAGRFLEQPHCGRGLAVCDLDNDGDPDVVFQRQDERPAVLRNMALERSADLSAAARTAIGPALTVRLVGTASNRDGIGARVTFRGSVGSAARQVRGGGSYLSAPDLRVSVAAPLARESVVVRWPSGRVSEIQAPAAKRGGETVIIEPAGAE